MEDRKRVRREPHEDDEEIGRQQRLAVSEKHVGFYLLSMYIHIYACT